MLILVEFSLHFLSVFELKITVKWSVESISISPEFIQAAQQWHWPSPFAWQDINHLELAIMLSTITSYLALYYPLVLIITLQVAL